MFRARPAVVCFMIGMGVDKGNPAYDMHVGKCDDTSQVRDKERGEAVLQVFSVVIRHSGCEDMIFMLCFRYDG